MARSFQSIREIVYVRTTYSTRWGQLQITNALGGATANQATHRDGEPNIYSLQAFGTSRENDPTLTIKTTNSSKIYNVLVGKKCLQAGAGRCYCVAAAVIYDLLRDPQFQSTLELAGSTVVNHSFVVVGRANINPLLPQNDIGNVAAWGDDAYAIDVWQANQKTGQMEDMIMDDIPDWDYAQQGGLVSKQVWDAGTRAADRLNANNWSALL